MNGEIRCAFRFSTGQMLSVLVVSAYPDGTPLITNPFPGSRGHISALLVRGDLSTLWTALLFVDAHTARGNEVPPLILPLVPGSRQDRLNPSGDYLFTLRSVAAEINARHFPSVTILDPHSLATPSLIDNCRVISARDCFAGSEPLRYRGVVAPDAGAEKRAQEIAQALEVPLIHAWKVRDVTSGALTDFGLEYSPSIPRGSRLLVVDDLCDAGGTFLGLGAIIRERGYLADLYVTHGLFTAGLDKLYGIYDRVITTDSVWRPGPLKTPEKGEAARLEVRPICERLLAR